MGPINTCCFCCTLETGAYILGSIGTCLSVVGIIVSTLVFEKVIKLEVPAPTLESHIICAIIALICFILLLWGTKKRKSGFLIPYLVFHMMSMILKFIAFITYLATTSHEDDKTSIPYCVGFLLGLTLGVYIEMSIYSLFLTIKEETLEVGTYKHFDDAENQQTWASQH